MPGGNGANADIVVIGGGIIGLSVAWYLAKEGVRVTVLERGQVGGQATGAAAGMLAPLAEAKVFGPFVELGLKSLHSYPAFVEALREETGLDAELFGPGMLRAAMTEEEAESLCMEWNWQRSLGLELERLDGNEARLLEPALSPKVQLALLSPQEKHVEPRRLVRALALACGRKGVRVLEGAPVIGFTTSGSRIIGVRTLEETFACDSVVVAGGAWTGILGEWLDIALPIFPVRGQILALSCLPPPIRHTVYTHRGYLVPKADGRVVVGATEDRAGFDARPTTEGLARLLALTPSLVPSLASACFESAWAGLRPASADGLPLLGRLPQWDNTYLASGHFRNGILLTPITGELMAQAILHGGLPAWAAAFDVDRLFNI